jgi:hypothetical protein
VSATLAGLDLQEATASLPAGCDRDFACELLLIAETAYVAAAFKKAEADKETEKSKADDADG